VKIVEPTIFDLSSPGRTGVTMPASDVPESALPPKELLRSELPLPELAEVDVVRHYMHLSSFNYSVDSGYYPLGSCTMKYNPKINEDTCRLPGFLFTHPGDWNIAHKEIDLRNWRSNRKNSGFLPEERAWLTGVFDKLGWVDVFRTLNDKPDQYTWWSNRGQAYAKNVGWRIDYQIATPGIARKAKLERIYKDKKFSDHAPLTIDYDFDL
jgi:hypothetical protein